MDIIRYFQDRDILFSDGGKNVSKNFIGIRCVYPECSDVSNHLGIHKEKLFHSCLKCGNKGGMLKLIMMIDSCSFADAKRILEKYSDFVLKVREFDDVENIPDRELKLPSCVRPLTREKFPKTILNYLIKRRFDPNTLVYKYKLMFGGLVGFFAKRLVVPITFNHRVVSALGIDVFGDSGIRYKNLPNRPNADGVCCARSVKNLVYNLETVKNKAIVVEGVTDVWRLGDGSVALMGIGYTSTQIEMLVSKKLTHIYILFDAEEQAQVRAKALGEELLLFGQNVDVISLPFGDPADLSQEDADNIKKRLNLFTD